MYADKDDNENPAPAPASAVGLPSSAHRLGASRAAPCAANSRRDLLDGETYYKEFGPLWTGTVCGQVTNADDASFGQAWVDMTQLRDGPSS